MSVVATAVVLFLLIILLMRTHTVRFGSALVCITFGLVLGMTGAGPALNHGLQSSGHWVWVQVNRL
jgi:hypothetical protein